MTIRTRRIIAALIDATIVGALGTAILLLVGLDTIVDMFHQKMTVHSEVGLLHIAAGPYLMVLDWFLLCFLDAMVVCILPLALVSLIGFLPLNLAAQNQLWLISSLCLLANALYRVGFEASPLHASIGMRLLKLRVPYGKFSFRRNPLIRHIAKMLTMPIIVSANLFGLPLAFLFFHSEESEFGNVIRQISGVPGDQLLHDEIATVEFETY